VFRAPVALAQWPVNADVAEQDSSSAAILRLYPVGKRWGRTYAKDGFICSGCGLAVEARCATPDDIVPVSTSWTKGVIEEQRNLSSS
jgi:hypothetical protein